MLLVFYFVTITVLAAIGILSRYPRWNNFNFGLFASTILLQIYLKSRCPLTVMEHKILKKYDPKLKYEDFLHNYMRVHFKLKVSPRFLNIAAYLQSAVFFVSYVVH